MWEHIVIPVHTIAGWIGLYGLYCVSILSDVSPFPSVHVFVLLLGGSQSVLSLEFCIGVLGGKHEQARYLVGFQG